MREFCIIVNQNRDDNFRSACQIRDMIEKLGGHVQILPGRADAGIAGEGFTDLTELSDGVEAALVLGGDGTVIQAARELADYDIPLMGINLGTVGFLTEIEMEHAETALKRLFAGDFRIEERLMLEGTVFRGEEVLYSGRSLNDIVVSRSGFSRIISAEMRVNGQLLNQYRGDGIIISTPTGSTAYNLSAGGPVIMPGAEVFAITPICAHSWDIRSTVTSAEALISLKIIQSKKSQKEEAIVSFDGNAGILLATGDRIEVRRARQKTHFLKIDQRDFLENLRNKISNGREEREVGR